MNMSHIYLITLKAPNNFNKILSFFAPLIEHFLNMLLSLSHPF